MYLLHGLCIVWSNIPKTHSLFGDKEALGDDFKEYYTIWAFADKDNTSPLIHERYNEVSCRAGC